MPAPSVTVSAKYYFKRAWAHLIEMSGVAPTNPHHLSSSSQPSIVRGPPHSFQHRSSLEEHNMHDRGERHIDGYTMEHSGYNTRDGPPHNQFNSSTHQHGTSNAGSNHNGTHVGSLGPGILHAPNSHHHTMMGPLSDADFNFSSTHHLHRANHGKQFIEFDTQPVEEMGKGTICAVLLTMMSAALIGCTLPFSLFFCIKVVQEYERAVIFRLGRLVSGGERGPGIFFIYPCIDTYSKVDLRTVSFDVPPQEILSKDSVTVAVDAVVYFRISNAIASVSNVEDYARSTRLLSATTLRNVLGTKNLSEILSERESISHMIQTSLDEATDSWGVKVERVEIKDVRLPVQLQRAMAAEAEAAREARAKVIAAEGEQRASKALREASEVISDSPAALQLRYLQTLNSIAAEKNSTIVFPVPMELFPKMMSNNNANCPSASSSSSSSTRSTPTNLGDLNSKPQSSPPSPSSHHHSHSHHNHHHHHHSSHHSHHHHGPPHHNYHHNVNQVTTSNVALPNSRTRQENKTNSNLEYRHSYFPDETELDQQQLIVNSSSTTNNNTNSTIVVKKHSRSKPERLLYDMVSASASISNNNISNLATNEDLANESFKSESSFPGFPASVPVPSLPNGVSGTTTSTTTTCANSQLPTSNNRAVEMSSRYFLETECSGANRDNLHLNRSGELGNGSCSILNETDDHSFPNQINAYNSGHESFASDVGLEIGNDISEFTE